MRTLTHLHLTEDKGVGSKRTLKEEYSTQTQRDIVDYMNGENIVLNYDNYRSTLLDFIAENYLNDLDIDEYCNEALHMLYKQRRTLKRDLIL